VENKVTIPQHLNKPAQTYTEQSDNMSDSFFQSFAVNNALNWKQNNPADSRSQAGRKLSILNPIHGTPKGFSGLHANLPSQKVYPAKQIDSDTASVTEPTPYTHEN
jgi:hypothetical protein